jgi:hypothetical protein
MQRGEGERQSIEEGTQSAHHSCATPNGSHLLAPCMCSFVLSSLSLFVQDCSAKLYAVLHRKVQVKRQATRSGRTHILPLLPEPGALFIVTVLEFVVADTSGHRHARTRPQTSSLSLSLLGCLLMHQLAVVRYVARPAAEHFLSLRLIPEESQVTAAANNCFLLFVRRSGL